MNEYGWQNKKLRFLNLRVLLNVARSADRKYAVAVHSVFAVVMTNYDNRTLSNIIHIYCGWEFELHGVHGFIPNRNTPHIKIQNSSFLSSLQLT